MTDHRPSVLFLCTGNSCRSQMAEGWLRTLHADSYLAYSAGIEAHGLNPLAVEAMQEAGVDISQQQSQTLDQLPIDNLDYVITVCAHADASCPVLPANIKRIHLGFDDPPKLAANAKSTDEAMPHYRRVRDEIRAAIEQIELHLTPE